MMEGGKLADSTLERGANRDGAKIERVVEAALAADSALKEGERAHVDVDHLDDRSNKTISDWSDDSDDDKSNKEIDKWSDEEDEEDQFSFDNLLQEKRNSEGSKDKRESLKKEKRKSNSIVDKPLTNKSKWESKNKMKKILEAEGEETDSSAERKPQQQQRRQSKFLMMNPNPS